MRQVRLAGFRAGGAGNGDRGGDCSCRGHSDRGGEGVVVVVSKLL